MARTKEFDPDVALDLAMELFWRRGYESASTTDLLAAAGIARASLYATFGTKHDLYLKALDRYLERKDGALIELLSRSGAALPLIVRAISSITDPGGNRAVRGCLMVNSAVGLLDDNDVALRVRASWGRTETALTGAFLRAQAQNEFAGRIDARALAALVLVFMQGARVIDKDPGSARRLRLAGAQLIRLLR